MWAGDQCRGHTEQEPIQHCKRMNNSIEGSERILQGGVEGPQKSGWRRDSGFKPGPVTDGKHLGIMERKRGLQPEKGRVESDPVQH